MQQIALKNLKTTRKRRAKSGRALEVDDDDEDNQGNKDEKGRMRKRRKSVIEIDVIAPALRTNDMSHICVSLFCSLNPCCATLFFLITFYVA